MTDLKPTILFGLVSMSMAEVMRSQFRVAYGAETAATLCYAALVLAAFVTVHAAYHGGEGSMA